MARAFYTEAPDPGRAAHVVHKNLALLAGRWASSDVRAEFPLRLPATPVVEEVPGAVGEHGFALVNPGAAWPNKRWPPERFGALAALVRDRLRAAVARALGTGRGAAGARGGLPRRGGSAEVRRRPASSDLLGIAQGARVMVSGDTGPLHIAGAVGTPLVAIFGPTRAERNGPWVGRTSRCRASIAACAITSASAGSGRRASTTSAWPR